jgi:hypothetical protein
MSDDQTIPAELPVLTPETTEEHAVMLDVHPPHHSVSTWRDFFIHMITIVLGLLIAIGLEQFVEALHHLHQRHELEAQLLDEAHINADVIEGNFKADEIEMAWLLGLQQDVRAMIASGGKTRFAYRLHPESSPGVPVAFVRYRTAVWDAAKEDATLALLPPPVAQSYTGSYGQEELASEYRFRMIDALNQQHAFEYKFASATQPMVPDLSRMDVKQLDDYSTLLAQSFAAAYYAKQRLREYESINNAVLKGLTNREEIARNRLALLRGHPDNFPSPSPGTPVPAAPTR